MLGIYDGYNRIDTKGKTTYFAGANTGEGFVGSYSDIVNEDILDKVYIIKGGPGTGKSSIMRSIALSAERNGYAVEYYLCGSDPDSIDCILIDKRIAVLDGTSPHSREMQYPGAKSTIIDVSKCWNESKLEAKCEKIMMLSAKKSLAYQSAYKYLKAAEQIENDSEQITFGVFNKAKAENYIDRLIKKLGKPMKVSGIAKHYYTHGITMKGMLSADSPQMNSSMIYSVTDTFSCSTHFMKLLFEKLLRSGYSITIGHIPICNYISEIFIEDIGVCFAVADSKSSERNINISRFVDKEGLKQVKGKFKLASKCREACISASLEALKTAATYHFGLEEIYKNAMDYDKLNILAENTRSDVINRLQK